MIGLDSVARRAPATPILHGQRERLVGKACRPTLAPAARHVGWLNIYGVVPQCGPCVGPESLWRRCDRCVVHMPARRSTSGGCTLALALSGACQSCYGQGVGGEGWRVLALHASGVSAGCTTSRDVGVTSSARRPSTRDGAPAAHAQGTRTASNWGHDAERMHAARSGHGHTELERRGARACRPRSRRRARARPANEAVCLLRAMRAFGVPEEDAHSRARVSAAEDARAGAAAVGARHVPTRPRPNTRGRSAFETAQGSVHARARVAPWRRRESEGASRNGFRRSAKRAMTHGCAAGWHAQLAPGVCTVHGGRQLGDSSTPAHRSACRTKIFRILQEAPADPLPLDGGSAAGRRALPAGRRPLSCRVAGRRAMPLQAARFSTRVRGRARQQALQMLKAQAASVA